MRTQNISSIIVKDNFYSFIKENLLFTGCKEKTVNMFATNAKFKNYKKDQVVYLEEEPSNFFYIIRSGCIKLFHETLDGNEAITDILGANDIFGENSAFDSGSYTCSSQIVEDTELCYIPSYMLKEQIQYDASLALNILTIMALHTRKQEKEIEHFMLHSAPQRIACFLLRLCPENKQKDICINLPYNKTLIALRLGMKGETFSRALNVLRKITKIRIMGARIEIDNIEQLRNFSCNSCSLSYPCMAIDGRHAHFIQKGRGINWVS